MTTPGYAEFVVKVSGPTRDKLNTIKLAMKADRHRQVTMEEVIAEMIMVFEASSALMRDIRTTP